jgi:hypothetical protein
LGGTISRTYCRTMGCMVSKFVKPDFEGRAIRTLTADDFDEWMADMAADDVLARSINLARQCVNAGLSYPVTLHRLPWNPLSTVKPYHETHSN